MTTPLGRAHFSPLGRGMLARGRCCCMSCSSLSRVCSHLRRPARSSLHRGSLPPPQSSFPTPLPSFLLFPHPSSRPRALAVLTAGVTFHHCVLQERDLLDLWMKEVSGKLPCAPLRGPPPPTITSLGSLVPTTPFALAPSGSRLPGSDPEHPIPARSRAPVHSVLHSCPFCCPLFLFPCTVSLSILFCPLSVLRPVTALGPLSLFFPTPSPPLLPYLLSQQLPHVLQRRVGLLKFSQHLWGQVSTCIRRGH